jgi:hypothetical protein
MAFVYREIVGSSINLARPGMDNADTRVDCATGLQQLELGRAVDREIVPWGRHRVQMTRLGGKIEEEILLSE